MQNIQTFKHSKHSTVSKHSTKSNIQRRCARSTTKAKKRSRGKENTAENQSWRPWEHAKPLWAAAGGLLCSLKKRCTQEKLWVGAKIHASLNYWPQNPAIWGIGRASTGGLWQGGQAASEAEANPYTSASKTSRRSVTMQHSLQASTVYQNHTFWQRQNM